MLYKSFEKLKNVLTKRVVVLLRVVVLIFLVSWIDVADFALSTAHPVPLRSHAEVTLTSLGITEFRRNTYRSLYRNMFGICVIIIIINLERKNQHVCVYMNSPADFC